MKGNKNFENIKKFRDKHRVVLMVLFFVLISVVSDLNNDRGIGIVKAIIYGGTAFLFIWGYSQEGRLGNKK